MEYEVYREKFEITKWRDGAVWETVSLGCGWFPSRLVEENWPRDTNILYVAASDEFAQNNSTTRKARS